jgi:ribosomal protein S18 acetylase RimI-like enzyme
MQAALQKATQYGYTLCRLETGERQDHAIAFYRKIGFISTSVADLGPESRPQDGELCLEMSVAAALQSLEMMLR